MTLLKVADIPVFLPLYIDESDEAMNELFSQAQLFAESSMGANRPLELVEHKVKKAINRTTGLVQLPYWPVGTISLVRVAFGGLRSSTRRGIPRSQWSELEASRYFVDDDGQLVLAPTGGQWASVTGNYYTSGISSQRQESVHWTQVEVTYTSGFDPNEVPASHELTQLKLALAGIVDYLANTVGHKYGIKRDRTKDVAEVEYQNSSTGVAGSGRAGTSTGYGVPELFLLPFKKYVPRGSIV